MSALIGALRATLGLDSAAFEKGASAIEKRSKGLERSLGKFGERVTGLGQTLSIAVTAPLVALGVTSVKAAIESREALGQVEAALGSMGDAAGRSSQQLQGLASGIMRQSLYDDDEVLRKVTANLLTFGNIAGGQFDRAQQAAVDLAARMKMDLQSATLLVGKALNDPAKGLAALKRAGIQFTEQQKEQIAAMAEAGNTAGAQAVMLKELERQFGGSAKAMRASDPFGAMKLSFGALQEAIGEKLLPALIPLADALTRLLDRFSNLSPGMQTFIVGLGAAAAALGPLLMGVGLFVKGMAPLIAVLATVAGEGGVLVAAKALFLGLGASLGPVLVPLAALAAAGALIYANWDKIGPVLSEFWEALKNAVGPEVTAMIDSLKTTLSDLWTGPLGEMVRQGSALLGDFAVGYLKAFGPPTVAVIKAFVQGLTNLFQMIGDGVRTVKAVFDGDWKTAITGAVSVFNRLFGGLPAYVAGIGQRIGEAIRIWVLDKLGAIWDGVEKRIAQVKQSFWGLYDAVVGHSYIPDMIDGIAAQMARLDAVMVGPAGKATEKTKTAFRKLAEDVGPLLERLFPEVVKARQYRREIELLGQALKNGILSPIQEAEARRRLSTEGMGLGALDAFMAENDKPIEGTPFEVYQDRLSKLTGGLVEAASKTGNATVSIAKSFKDMADDTLSALDRMVGAIKGGGFLNILSSVIGLGLQLGSIGLFGKGVAANINAPKIPALASGTRFHAGGLAMVGERGPELVNLPRGSRVWPNGTGPGGGVVHNHFSGNLMTPEFWGIINRGDLAAAQAGSVMGAARMSRAAEWTLR
jgi:hypothetical protein